MWICQYQRKKQPNKSHNSIHNIQQLQINKNTKSNWNDDYWQNSNSENRKYSTAIYIIWETTAHSPQPINKTI